MNKNPYEVLGVARDASDADTPEKAAIKITETSNTKMASTASAAIAPPADVFCSA